MTEIPPVMSFKETVSRLPAHLHSVGVEPPDTPIVVLDDDPTGTQTVHGVSVITSWSVPLLVELLSERPGMFFILSNSRAVAEKQAVAMNREIADNLCTAAEHTGTRFEIISRSDSTLRGHYPAELVVLRETLERRTGIDFAGEIVVPCFFEGGRYTIDDLHYVRFDDRLVPAGATEYAADRSFGYSSSDLKDWIAEKTEGRVAASEVLSIGLDAIRTGGVASVTELLQASGRYRPIVVNGVDYADLSVVSQALREAARAGRHFLYRSAASFVRAFGAITERPLLTAAELAGQSADGADAYRGGLVVVGSHIQRSSEQLTSLLESVRGVELFAERVVGGESERQAEADRVWKGLRALLEAGDDAVLYTSRKLEEVDDPAGNLAIGKAVSQALVSVVSRLERRPKYLIAKGGITSSDIATEALGIDRAEVLGQVHPGVPVWRTGKATKFPGLLYVVFPGNVGDREALRFVRGRLSNVSE